MISIVSTTKFVNDVVKLAESHGLTDGEIEIFSETGLVRYQKYGCRLSIHFIDNKFHAGFVSIPQNLQDDIVLPSVDDESFKGNKEKIEKIILMMVESCREFENEICRAIVVSFDDLPESESSSVVPISNKDIIRKKARDVIKVIEQRGMK